MTAHTAKSKKAKGTKLEALIAKRIREVLGSYGIDAKRMPLSGAMTGFKSDIFVNLPISIEAKNQETWKIPEWWDQATDSCAMGKMPILVVSRNYCNDPLAVIRFEDLLFLFELALQSGWVSYIRKGRSVMR